MAQTKLKVNKVIKFIKDKKIQKIIFLILLAVIFFNFGSTVLSLREKYTSSNYWQSFSGLEKVYYDSIYKNKNGIWLSDETLYSYIGGALIKGKSPILLNPEVPPFGTYLIGLSVLIFNNQHLVILFFAALDLYLIFLLGKQIYSSKITPIIPVALFSFEPIFKNQLIYTPLLDIIQLTFLLTIFLFFNKLVKDNENSFKNALLVNIFLGFFISTKFFGTGIAVVLAILITLLLHKEFKKIKFYLLTLPVSVFILYFNYIKVLIDGYPINRFLGIQRWIFEYNQGHVTQPFSIWPLILVNKWYVWFGNKPVISDPQWLITWPIITVFSIITIFINLIRKFSKREVEIIFFWIIFYFSLMSFVQATARYFVILIPFLYLVFVYGVEQYIIKALKKK